MRLDPSAALARHPIDEIEVLRVAFEDAPAEAVLEAVLETFPGQVAMVSSFGAEAAVLLKMIADIDKDLPVLMIDSLLLFEETLDYQRTLSGHLGLRNVRIIRPSAEDLRRADPDDTLHLRDHDACCDLRKVLPLDRALRGWPVSITGRKRFQAATRTALRVIERDGARLKVNPLARWSAQGLRDYMDAHDLPKHPLVAKGFRSIGCAPCTTPVRADEDDRAGRWRGSDKVECGIHFGADGRILRAAS